MSEIMRVLTLPNHTEQVGPTVDYLQSIGEVKKILLVYAQELSTQIDQLVAKIDGDVDLANAEQHAVKLQQIKEKLQKLQEAKQVLKLGVGQLRKALGAFFTGEQVIRAELAKNEELKAVVADLEQKIILLDNQLKCNRKNVVVAPTPESAPTPMPVVEAQPIEHGQVETPLILATQSGSDSSTPDLIPPLPTPTIDKPGAPVSSQPLPRREVPQEYAIPPVIV